MTECIHGLDAARCDVCSPRKSAAPGSTASTVKPTRARPKRAARAGGTTKPVVVDTGTRRIFHITHVRNLEGILSEKQILSDAGGAQPVLDISSPDNRELRRGVSTGSATVAAYVPFFLSTDAILWEELRSGTINSRLSHDSQSLPASEFVILVGSVRAAGLDSVIAGGDAADPATEFSSPDSLGGRMPRRFFEEEDSLRSAEFLVLNGFPIESVSLIGVANDKVRARVRELITAHGFAHKISVYPPWFQRP